MGKYMWVIHIWKTYLIQAWILHQQKTFSTELTQLINSLHFYFKIQWLISRKDNWTLWKMAMNVLLLLPVKAHAYYDSVLFSSHSNSCHYNRDLIMSISYVQLKKNSDFCESQVECFRNSHLKKFSLKMRKKMLLL